MTPLPPRTLGGLLLVVAFDLTNGFHDAANVVATMIASRALGPGPALLMVAAAAFLGPLVGGVAVADTLGGIVRVDQMAPAAAELAVMGGLAGAVLWNLLTWRLGIPSSSTFALVGGLAGAAMHAGGPGRVAWGIAALARGRVEGVAKILVSLAVSPALGFLLGFVAQRGARRLLARARPGANRALRRAQILTSSALAFSFGTNDAQKGMAVLTLLLVVGGQIPRYQVPVWVMALCAGVLTLGAVSGGRRLIRTLGDGIYRVRPLHALDSQLVSAAVVLAAGQLGGPVSTTHVVTTSIMGVGAADRPRAVRWRRARGIALTWIITIPAAAGAGALVHAGLRALLR